MATIKPIERQSVHQIQSGQVIVDLYSVAKELVENSLDAGATSIDVRFKNNGLDVLEVQDNGQGISPENFETVALKHYTSKLSSYADLDSLETFGFRGEALSSLCAVSDLYIVTAQAHEAPRGTKLEFERSGELKETHVAATPKGTTVVVQNIFKTLPVRRRELEKNIKREYVKVLAILQAYACISTGVKFTVSNQTNKGKRVTVFATKANKTTRENISNVFGSKILATLMPLDIESELQPRKEGQGKGNNEDEDKKKNVRVLGHISRPAFGETRQAPDRQMFFVNTRPCGLPQVARAFNDVYKSYSVSQSPFVLADLKMDTNSYDVNVSPDKRTIFIHDQSALLEALRTSVAKLLEAQDQTLPQNQLSDQRLPAFKQLSLSRQPTNASDASGREERAIDDTLVEDPIDDFAEEESDSEANDCADTRLPGHPETGASVSRYRLTNHDRHDLTPSGPYGPSPDPPKSPAAGEDFPGKQHLDMEEDAEAQPETADTGSEISHQGDLEALLGGAISQTLTPPSANELGKAPNRLANDPVPSISLARFRQKPGALQDAFDRMRSKRRAADTATITIDSKTIVSPLNGSGAKKPKLTGTARGNTNDPRRMLASKLRTFAASASRANESGGEYDEPEDPPSDSDQEPVSPSEVSQQEDRDSDSDALDTGQPADGAQSGRHESDSLPRTGNDEDFDEAIEHSKEDAKVAELIQAAEEHVYSPSLGALKRLRSLKGGSTADSTIQLVQPLETSIEQIEKKAANLYRNLERYMDDKAADDTAETNDINGTSPEEQLSLTVSKDDFGRMNIVGQFNLGFILATRRASSHSRTSTNPSSAKSKDELFIIDQHASDEIYNFERLQATTVVQSQPLVNARVLELTAIEEETLIENQHVLEKNGFVVEVDDTGAEPVGRRCKLVSLPMSREVVFDMRDLEELLALLADSPQSMPNTSTKASSSSTTTTTTAVPRPSKVRRMFAMRACRSSIMIGRTLTARQMVQVVRHMGEIDKPWNCPHGRPTMRHIARLNDWVMWEEGEGLDEQGRDDDVDGSMHSQKRVWADFLLA